MSTASDTQYAANRALAQVYGKPVLGGSGALTFDGTDKTFTAVGGSVYIVSPTTDAFLAVDGVATTAGNRLFIKGGTQDALVFGAPGSAPVVHVTQVTATGTLYYSQMADAGV